MKNLHLTVALIIVVLLPLNLFAQDKLKGNRVVTKENRDIDAFTSIEINDKIEVVITQGYDQSVVVEADENIHVAVFAEVRDSTLIIDLTKRIVRKKELKVLVNINKLVDKITTKDKSEISSSGTIEFNNLTINAEDDSKISLDFQTTKFVLNNNESANVKLTFNADDVVINADKSGKAKLNLSCNTIEASLKGGSTHEIIGNCSELFINAESRSRFKGGSFESIEAVVETSNNVEVEVNAKSELLISTTDNAEIHIFNDPKITIEKFSDKAILRKK